MITLALAIAASEPPPADTYGLGGWYDCIVREREVFARSDEPIELLAVATIAACKDAEDAMFKATIAEFRRNADPMQARRLAKDAIAETKAVTREGLIEFFVRRRLPKK